MHCTHIYSKYVWMVCLCSDMEFERIVFTFQTPRYHPWLLLRQQIHKYKFHNLIPTPVRCTINKIALGKLLWWLISGYIVYARLYRQHLCLFIRLTYTTSIHINHPKNLHIILPLIKIPFRHWFTIMYPHAGIQIAVYFTTNSRLECRLKST